MPYQLDLLTKKSLDDIISWSLALSRSHYTVTFLNIDFCSIYDMIVVIFIDIFGEEGIKHDIKKQVAFSLLL